MIDITQDIQPLTTFRNNSVEFLRRLKTTKRPLILTVNGKPEAGLQDPAEYQRLLDIADRAEALEGIRRGLKDVAAGRTRPAKEVFDELRANTRYRVELSTTAAIDLEEIYFNVQAPNSSTASRWFNALEELVFSLDFLPERGKPTPEDRHLRQLLMATNPIATASSTPSISRAAASRSSTYATEHGASSTQRNSSPKPEHPHSHPCNIPPPIPCTIEKLSTR